MFHIFVFSFSQTLNFEFTILKIKILFIDLVLNFLIFESGLKSPFYIFAVYYSIFIFINIILLKYLRSN